MQALVAAQLAGQRARAGKRDQGGARHGRRVGPPPRRSARIGRPANPGIAQERFVARYRAAAAGPDVRDLIGRVEREYFVRVLSLYKGNVARTARHSGLSRRSVTQKLQRYGLDRATFRSAEAARVSSSTSSYRTSRQAGCP